MHDFFFRRDRLMISYGMTWARNDSSIHRDYLSHSVCIGHGCVIRSGGKMPRQDTS